MLYLDTSLLVCALTNAPKTATVQAWLSQQPANQLTVSDWVTTEFSSSLSIKVRSGALDPVLRGAILARFTKMLSQAFNVLRVDAPAFPAATRFCDQAQLNLRSGDALHLAVCAEHGATICTLDRVLDRAALALGVASILV